VILSYENTRGNQNVQKNTEHPTKEKKLFSNFDLRGFAV
jgi:hypothetical protein